MCDQAHPFRLQIRLTQCGEQVDQACGRVNAKQGTAVFQKLGGGLRKILRRAALPRKVSRRIGRSRTVFGRKIRRIGHHCIQLHRINGRRIRTNRTHPCFQTVDFRVFRIQFTSIRGDIHPQKREITASARQQQRNQTTAAKKITDRSPFAVESLGNKCGEQHAVGGHGLHCIRRNKARFRVQKRLACPVHGTHPRINTETGQSVAACPISYRVFN